MLKYSITTEHNNQFDLESNTSPQSSPFNHPGLALHIQNHFILGSELLTVGIFDWPYNQKVLLRQCRNSLNLAPSATSACSASSESATTLASYWSDAKPVDAYTPWRSSKNKNQQANSKELRNNTPISKDPFLYFPLTADRLLASLHRETLFNLPATEETLLYPRVLSRRRTIRINSQTQTL